MGQLHQVRCQLTNVWLFLTRN